MDRNEFIGTLYYIVGIKENADKLSKHMGDRVIYARQIDFEIEKLADNIFEDKE
jgi:hypothetical protein